MKANPRAKISLFFWCSIFILASNAQLYAQASDETKDSSKLVWRGTVRSKDGKPISGVLVSSPPSLISGVRSSADGSFDLQITRYSGIVYFWHPDYRPFAKHVNQLTFKDKLDIVLEPGKKSQWNMPECSKVERPDLYVGIGSKLRVRVPEKTYIISGFTNEFIYYQIRHTSIVRSNGIDWPISEFLGLGAKLPDPGNSLWPMEEICGRVEQRTWKSGLVIGVDCGRKGDRIVVGKDRANYISYRTNVEKAAADFDKIIDTACYEKTPDRSYLKKSGALDISIKTVPRGRRPGMEVELSPLNPMHAEPSFYRSSTGIISGRFTFKNLPVGLYSVETNDIHRKYKKFVRIDQGKTKWTTISVLPITDKDIEDMLKNEPQMGDDY